MATVRWFIDNKLYNGSSPHLYDITNTTAVDPLTEDTVISSFFHIKKVRREDLANYTCQATNNVIGQGEKMANKSTTLIISRELFFSFIIGLVNIAVISENVRNPHTGFERNPVSKFPGSLVYLLSYSLLEYRLSSLV